MFFNHNLYGFLLNKSIACKKKVFNLFRAIFTIVLIPSRYLAKADCRAKPGGAYFLSVGDTVFPPPTTDARLTIQFIPLPTFHLEVRRILVFLIKLPSFLKQIFHIYPFLEERYFYKKKLLVKLGNDVFVPIHFVSIHFVSSELLTQHINR